VAADEEELETSLQRSAERYSKMRAGPEGVSSKAFQFLQVEEAIVKEHKETGGGGCSGGSCTIF